MKNQVDMMRIDCQVLEMNLDVFLGDINCCQLQKRYKIKYSIATLMPLPISFIKLSILYLFKIKFPLLINYHTASATIQNYDCLLKQLYQAQINHHRFISQFDFQLLILFLIKLFVSFFMDNFKEIAVTGNDEREMFCVIIKMLIGMKMTDKSYALIEKKYIDNDMMQEIDLNNLDLKQFSKANKGKETANSSKRMITMNSIQNKIYKRKIFKMKELERMSLRVNQQNQEIQKFRESVRKQLAVSNRDGKKIVGQKINYSTIQERKMNQLQHFREGTKIMSGKLYRNTIQTEQISSSLQLNLMMQNIPHSYSRRNAKLKQSYSQNRLSYPVFDVPAANLKQQNQQKDSYFKLKKEGLKVVMKKTKAYWKNVIQKIKQDNNSFEY